MPKGKVIIIYSNCSQRDKAILGLILTHLRITDWLIFKNRSLIKFMSFCGIKFTGSVFGLCFYRTKEAIEFLGYWVARQAPATLVKEDHEILLFLKQCFMGIPTHVLYAGLQFKLIDFMTTIHQTHLNDMSEKEVINKMRSTVASFFENMLKWLT